MIGIDDVNFVGLDILVVEDDHTSLKLTVALLKKYGANVHKAENGYEALKTLALTPIPLVITDIEMPDMDGFELAEKVLLYNADIQLIALSAHKETDCLIKAIRLGFNDYLLKPANFEDLIWAVKKCHDSIKIRKQLEKEQRKFKIIFDCLGEGVTVKDQNFVVLYQNRAMIDIFGNAEGKFCYNLMGNDEPCNECPTIMALRDGATHSVCRTFQKDGTTFHIESTASLITDSGGAVIGTVEIFRDVSDQKKIENILGNISKGVAASVGTDFFSTLVNYLTDALEVQFAMIGELNDSGDCIHTLVFCQKGIMLENFDFKLEGTPCARAINDKIAIFPNNVRANFPGLQLQGQIIESYCGARLSDSKGRASGVLCTFHTKPMLQPDLVTKIVTIFASRASVELERLKNEKIIRDMAFHDPLTGLANRRLFEDRIEQAIAKSQRYNMSCGLIFLDLDNFKEINDRYGHDAGDRVLVEAGQRIKSCCKRNLDTISRYGGDEFCIIITDCGDKNALRMVAEHLLAEFNRPFTEIGEGVHVTASIGVSMYPEDGTEWKDLGSAADKAMYAAKQAGRNMFQMISGDGLSIN